MSTLSADRLYSLLPAVYRIRDEQQGQPLRALVALIAQEFEALEENVEQLYDDQFIETCEEWVAPYIGDLIGYRPLHGVAAAIASPRAEVANTIGYRRRKGTAAMLEQLARDVTDWPARAVEFFEQLATTQYMNHVRLYAPATADLRSMPKMLQLGGAFNVVAHTAEMRRPEGASGRYNIPNIGIFLWRLQAFSLSNVPLTADPTDTTGRKFRFNPLGADQPLFRLPVTETLISHIAEPMNVPEPINLRLMARAVKGATNATLDDDYGFGESIVLSRPDANPAQPPIPIDVADICVCDLRNVTGGWAHEATLAATKIAIDPRLGRVLLGTSVTGSILGTFHSGFSRPIGGGEYERSLAGGALVLQPTASQSEALQPHLNAIKGGGRLVIQDSLTYAQTPTFKVDGVTALNAPGLEVVVAACNGARPLIASGGPITLDIGARGRLVLDGLVITGGALQLAVPPAGDHEPRELVLRHCTLVPGLALNTDGTAVSPGAASLIVEHAFTRVTLEQCIVGALQIERDTTVAVTECIVDAGSQEAVAFAGTAPGGPGAEMTIRDSTVIGKLHVRLMRLASNTIFLTRLAAPDTWKAPLWVERKQEGCVRFCFVPDGSLVPKRFRCAPDEKHPDALPHFTSQRYGDPGYAQLRSATDKVIREGADDEGEIGVMHPLFQPQRETNLRIRLDEYLRFGLHAGIFYVT
ncbi:MAG: hypothetical protein ACTS6J_02370 [Burkholderiales bacterium]